MTTAIPTTGFLVNLWTYLPSLI